VPWCDDCSRFYNADSLTGTGACPTCGAKLARPGPADEAHADDGDKRVVPWHFWVLVVALVIYLGWRLIQGIGWVSRHL
jgi:hypothetical protein